MNWWPWRMKRLDEPIAAAPAVPETIDERREALIERTALIAWNVGQDLWNNRDVHTCDPREVSDECARRIRSLAGTKVAQTVDP